jgi:hypothetical protein
MQNLSSGVLAFTRFAESGVGSGPRVSGKLFPEITFHGESHMLPARKSPARLEFVASDSSGRMVWWPVDVVLAVLSYGDQTRWLKGKC